MTAELALRVGRAVASEGATRVVVGRDPRESGELLSDALCAGLRECGATAVRLGQAATPTVARAIEWEDADAGVVVTASHNPPADNGLKLWNPSGLAFTPDQQDALRRRIETEAFDLRPWDRLGSSAVVDDATDRHVDYLVEESESDGGLTVVVDVGNGCGRLTVAALRRLGHNVRTLNATPDGRFPGRPSEPTAANCLRLRLFVGSTDADLGIAHDGDADRMLAVSETGEFIDGDALLALFGRFTARPGETIAAPVNTSLAVHDYLEANDVSIVQTRVGDGFVAARTDDPGVVFGGEPSGAWIWPDGSYCPDGPRAAIKLVELVERHGPLSSLVGDIERTPIRRESVPVEAKADVMRTVRKRIDASYDDVTTIDGVRVTLDEGWFLIRASGTQPLIRLTAEGRTERRAQELLDAATELVTESSERVGESNEGIEGRHKLGISE